MKIGSETITLKTGDRLEFHDITKMVRECIGRHPVTNGMVLLSALHTTVALFINEFQDALLHDMRAILGRLIKERDGYRHDDPRYSDCPRRNADSHMRSVLLNRNLAFSVVNGDLVLGQFQSIIFAELDGPRERSLQVQIVGE